MNQQKIGQFLRELRKEKNLTQEALAEHLGVAGRTVSRWETGSNMPDISLLVDLANFYEVSIPEIVDGERKSENMTEETRDTAIKMAEYSKSENSNSKKKVIGLALIVFGAIVVVMALATFPSDSSWGAVYSVLGGIVLTIGVYLWSSFVVVGKGKRLAAAVACAVILFGVFHISDYVAVKYGGQLPRFTYETEFVGTPDGEVIRYKTLFYTVVRENPDTEEEQIYIQ